MSQEITKDQFLSLPPTERKRLAAKRTIERRKASKKGTEIPPTYAEQFGLSKRKDKPFGSRTESQKSPAPKEAGKRPTKDMVEKKRQAFVDSFVPEYKKEEPYWRTIGEGMLHCTGQGVLSKYLAEAKRRGMEKLVEYREGDRLIGTIFGEDITEKQRMRLQTILTGTTGKLLTFGEVEGIA